MSNYLIHYGVGHLHGGHSGRYPWGSGENNKFYERLARRLKTPKDALVVDVYYREQLEKLGVKMTSDMKPKFVKELVGKKSNELLVDDHEWRDEYSLYKESLDKKLGTVSNNIAYSNYYRFGSHNELKFPKETILATELVDDNHKLRTSLFYIDEGKPGSNDSRGYINTGVVLAEN